MKTKTAHFVVTGEFITQLARSLWNDEDEPKKALAMLECMRGITEAQCLSVLEGKAKLIGDSSAGIDLVPDKAKGKSLKQIIGGLRDERDEARDERADLFAMAAGDTVNVSSETGLREVPLRKTKRTKRNNRALIDGYDFDDGANSSGDPKSKKLRIWKQISDDAQARRAESIIYDSIAADEQKREPPKPPPAEDKITNDTGWLTPEGKFYPCRYGGHRQVAEAVGFSDQDQAFVRVAKMDKRQWFFTEPGLVTPTQRKLIRDYCTTEKVELPYWLEDP